MESPRLTDNQWMSCPTGISFPRAAKSLPPIARWVACMSNKMTQPTEKHRPIANTQKTTQDSNTLSNQSSITKLPRLMRQSLDDIPWLESLFGFPRDNRASTAENNWISFKKKPLSL